MKSKLNILICPLEWGLGHAGRMIPLAVKLQEQGHKIFIGSGKEHLEFMRSELLNAELIHFPGFRPVYSGFLPQYAAVLFQLPVLFYHMVKEHSALSRIIGKYEIDLVISDNRFALWNKRVRTVYVTHQLRIPFPAFFRFLEPAGIFLHRLIINKFDHCLIPDLPGDINLSGIMSHGLKLPRNAMYTGILSRFSSEESGDASGVKNRTLIILSGPEPQKSILGKKLVNILDQSYGPVTILEGRPGKTVKSADRSNVKYFSNVTSSEMKTELLNSSRVIARSGYSTIMELVSLNRTAILIPTPGQTEQEYLARLLSEKGWFTSMGQARIGKSPFSFIEKCIWTDEITRRSRELLENATKVITGF